MPRGKLLGGSSGINYLMYVRGSRGDYDSWASLGNKGWGWNDLVPYFQKHQTIDLPDDKIKGSDPQLMPHANVSKYHGTKGPIHTSFNDFRMPVEEDFIKACYTVGRTMNTLVDAWSGDHLGFYSSLGAIDRTENPGTRSYAATGYLKPNLGRPNLKVLTQALASKIILQNDSRDGVIATGVEFVYGGKSFTAKAAREVVLSAGVIQTPQILELSGIGDPQVLGKAGIKCQVENKSVGANFQDHVLGGTIFECADGVLSLDALHEEDYGQAQQQIYDKEGIGPFGSPGMCMGFVSYASLVTPGELKATIERIRKNSHAKTPFEKAQEELIIKQLSDPTFANLQTFLIPANMDMAAGGDQTKLLGPPPKGKNRVSLLICLEHPLSRGTVHITTSDPESPPRIDPGYFRNGVDAEILAAGVQWIDRVSRHPLLAKSLGERVQPAPDVSLESEQERVDFLRNHIATQYHLIGTAAMGEVVDDRLRVKGVGKLRVVDASVFPGHVSGNIMSTTYAVAEKGADLIKEDATA